MIGQTEIMQAVRGLVREQLPQLRQVELDLMSADDLSPGMLIEFSEASFCEKGPNTVQVIQRFALKVYDDVQAAGASGVRRLLELQEQVMRLFVCGRLRVGDRALPARVRTAGRERDSAAVELILEYLDTHGEQQEYQVMEALHTSINANRPALLTQEAGAEPNI